MAFRTFKTRDDQDKYEQLKPLYAKLNDIDQHLQEIKEELASPIKSRGISTYKFLGLDSITDIFKKQANNFQKLIVEFAKDRKKELDKQMTAITGLLNWMQEYYAKFWLNHPILYNLTEFTKWFGRNFIVNMNNLFGLTARSVYRAPLAGEYTIQPLSPMASLVSIQQAVHRRLYLFTRYEFTDYMERLIRAVEQSGGIGIGSRESVAQFYREVQQTLRDEQERIANYIGRSALEAIFRGAREKAQPVVESIRNILQLRMFSPVAQLFEVLIGRGYNPLTSSSVRRGFMDLFSSLREHGPFVGLRHYLMRAIGFTPRASTDVDILRALQNINQTLEERLGNIEQDLDLEQRLRNMEQTRLNQLFGSRGRLESRTMYIRGTRMTLNARTLEQLFQSLNEQELRLLLYQNANLIGGDTQVDIQRNIDRIINEYRRYRRQQESERLYDIYSDVIYRLESNDVFLPVQIDPRQLDILVQTEKLGSISKVDIVDALDEFYNRYILFTNLSTTSSGSMNLPINAGGAGTNQPLMAAHVSTPIQTSSTTVISGQGRGSTIESILSEQANNLYNYYLRISRGDQRIIDQIVNRFRYYDPNFTFSRSGILSALRMANVVDEFRNGNVEFPFIVGGLVVRNGNLIEAPDIVSVINIYRRLNPLARFIPQSRLRPAGNRAQQINQLFNIQNFNNISSVVSRIVGQSNARLSNVATFFNNIDVINAYTQNRMTQDIINRYVDSVIEASMGNRDAYERILRNNLYLDILINTPDHVINQAITDRINSIYADISGQDRDVLRRGVSQFNQLIATRLRDVQALYRRSEQESYEEVLERAERISRQRVTRERLRQEREPVNLRELTETTRSITTPTRLDRFRDMITRFRESRFGSDLASLITRGLPLMAGMSFLATIGQGGGLGSAFATASSPSGWLSSLGPTLLSSIAFGSMYGPMGLLAPLAFGNLKQFGNIGELMGYSLTGISDFGGWLGRAGGTGLGLAAQYRVLGSLLPRWLTLPLMLMYNRKEIASLLPTGPFGEALSSFGIPALGLTMGTYGFLGSSLAERMIGSQAISTIRSFLPGGGTLSGLLSRVVSIASAHPVISLLTLLTVATMGSYYNEIKREEKESESKYNQYKSFSDYLRTDIGKKIGRAIGKQEELKNIYISPTEGRIIKTKFSTLTFSEMYIKKEYVGEASLVMNNIANILDAFSEKIREWYEYAKAKNINVTTTMPEYRASGKAYVNNYMVKFYIDISRSFVANVDALSNLTTNEGKPRKAIDDFLKLLETYVEIAAYLFVDKPTIGVKSSADYFRDFMKSLLFPANISYPKWYIDTINGFIERRYRSITSKFFELLYSPSDIASNKRFENIVKSTYKNIESVEPSSTLQSFYEGGYSIEGIKNELRKKQSFYGYSYDIYNKVKSVLIGLGKKISGEDVDNFIDFLRNKGVNFYNLSSDVVKEYYNEWASSGTKYGKKVIDYLKKSKDFIVDKTSSMFGWPKKENTVLDEFLTATSPIWQPTYDSLKYLNDTYGFLWGYEKPKGLMDYIRENTPLEKAKEYYDKWVLGNKYGKKAIDYLKKTKDFVVDKTGNVFGWSKKENIFLDELLISTSPIWKSAYDSFRYLNDTYGFLWGYEKPRGLVDYIQGNIPLEKAKKYYGYIWDTIISNKNDVLERLKKLGISGKNKFIEYMIKLKNYAQPEEEKPFQRQYDYLSDPATMLYEMEYKDINKNMASTYDYYKNVVNEVINKETKKLSLLKNKTDIENTKKKIENLKKIKSKIETEQKAVEFGESVLKTPEDVNNNRIYDVLNNILIHLKEKLKGPFGAMNENNMQNINNFIHNRNEYNNQNIINSPNPGNVAFSEDVIYSLYKFDQGINAQSIHYT